MQGRHLELPVYGRRSLDPAKYHKRTRPREVTYGHTRAMAATTGSRHLLSPLLRPCGRDVEQQNTVEKPK